MKFFNRFIIFILLLNVKVVLAGDNDIPVELFVCTIPTETMPHVSPL